MLKWRNGFIRTALVALGVGLLGNFAGLTAMAAATGSDVPAGGQNEGPKTAYVTFDALEDYVLHQQIELNGSVNDVQFPQALKGTWMPGNTTGGEQGTEDISAGPGMGSVILGVTQNQGADSQEISIPFNGWKLQGGGQFDSSVAGAAYTYVPVLPKTDNAGNTLTYLKRPVITVTIAGADNDGNVSDDNSGNDADSVLNNGNNSSDNGIMAAADDEGETTLPPPSGGTWHEFGMGLKISADQAGAITYDGNANSFILNASTGATFYIKGEWRLPDVATSTPSEFNVAGNIIRVTGSGKPTIYIEGGTKIDTSQYDDYIMTKLFVVDSGVEVDLRVLGSTPVTFNAYKQADGQMAYATIQVDGKLNLLQNNLKISGYLENTGTITVGGTTLSSTLETDIVMNKKNVAVTNNGTLKVMTSIENKGTLTANTEKDSTLPLPKMELASVVNSGTWEINGGQGKVNGTVSNASSGTIKVTNGTLAIGGDITNSGSMTFIDGGSLGLAATLTNSGTLTIDDKATCITGAGNIVDAEGTFIFDGIPDDLLYWGDDEGNEWGSPLKLEYTGKNQLDYVKSCLKMREKTELGSYPGILFDIKINNSDIQEEIILNRTASDKIDPVTDLTCTAIEEPGNYEIAYTNARKPNQKSSVSAVMSTWSIKLIPDKGLDDYAQKNYADKVDAVYEYNKDKINLKVEIAIFSERNAGEGKIKLEFTPYDTFNRTPLNNYCDGKQIYNKDILLTDKGCNTTAITWTINPADIEGGGRDIKLPVPYPQNLGTGTVDPNNPFPKDTPYDMPYMFKFSFTSKDGATEYEEPTYENNGMVKRPWSDSKKIVIKRQIVDMELLSGYPRIYTYNREKLREPDPAPGKNELYLSNTGAMQISCVWFKGSKEEVDSILAENGTPTLAVTKDVADMEAQEDEARRKDPLRGEDYVKNLVAGGAPMDAGTYTLQVNLEGTSEVEDSSGTWTITINRAEVEVRAKDAEKYYGEKEPDWSSPDCYSPYGLLKDDILTGRLSREPGQDAGSYLIERGDLLNSNYNVTFKGANFLIKPRQLIWDTSKLIFAKDANGVNFLVGGLDVTYEQGNDIEDPLDPDGIKYLFDQSKASGGIKVTYNSISILNNETVLRIGGKALEGLAKGNYDIPITVDVPVAEANKEYELVISGIDKIKAEDMEVLEEYDASLKSTGDVENAMKKHIQGRGVAEKNISVSDVAVKWKTSGSLVDILERYPKGTNITIIMSYPNGTAKTTHNFIAAHMFTHEIAGFKPAAIEPLSATATDIGVQFTVTSLSPVSLGWTTSRNNGGDNIQGGDGNNGNGNNNNGNNNGNNDNNTNKPDDKKDDDKNNDKNNNKATSSNTTNNKTTGTTNKTNTTNRTGTNGDGSTASSTITKALGAVTGDNAPIVLYAVLTFVGMALLVFVILMMKKAFSNKS